MPDRLPLPDNGSSHLGTVPVASAQETRDRVIGVWGPRAYAWGGEERQRAAGFPIDPSGRQRVLGFPADSFTPVGRDWRRKLARALRTCTSTSFRANRRDGLRGQPR